MLRGCRSPGDAQPKRSAVGGARAGLQESKFHDVYAGRAIFQVSEGVEVSLSDTQVGQVTLARVAADSRQFETLWSERLGRIRSGEGERDVITTIERAYPGQHTTLYDTTGGHKQGRSLEHRQTFGNVVGWASGREVGIKSRWIESN